MWQDIGALIRFDKPIGTWLLLWPTLWGLWFATNGAPSLSLIIVFVLGTALMRAAGCAINDIFDRNIDARVTRTKTRPLAAKRLPLWIALLVGGSLLLAAYFLVALTCNALTQQLAWIGAGLAILYPLLKRFFAMPQAGLGLAFGFGIPMAFAAATNTLPAIAWWLYAATACWIIAYDTQYAMMDQEDDAKINVRSSARLFGAYQKPIILFLQTAFIALLATAAWFAQISPIFYGFLALCSLFFIYQYYLLQQATVSAYGLAFRNNHWVGAVIFLGTMLCI